MTENAFWYIIDRARHGSQDRRYASLWAQLSDVEIEGIVGFAKVLIEKRTALLTLRTWQVATLFNGTMDAAKFRSFMDWVISNGRDFAQLMQNDPDEVANHVSSNFFGEARFDNFSKIPAEVWREKTGEDPWANGFANFPRVMDCDMAVLGALAPLVSLDDVSIELPQLTQKFAELAFGRPPPMRVDEALAPTNTRKLN